MLHTYPNAGDIVRLNAEFYGCKKGTIGIIEGCEGELRDAFFVCFSPSAHRDTSATGRIAVSCSGGPVPRVSSGDLVPTGETAMATFWRFKNGIRQAGNDEHYRHEVAVWEWTPGQMRPKLDKAIETYRFWEESGALHVLDARMAAKTLCIETPRQLPDMGFVRSELKSNKVPGWIARCVEWFCSAAYVRGSCDPIYLSNVIAFETANGDGQGNFVDEANCRAPNQEEILRITDRITGAYRSCMTDAGLSYGQVLANLQLQSV